MAKQIRNEDDALVARCLEGATEVFRWLVERHQHSVFSIALRMVGNREEAMDLAQETFVRAFASLCRYCPDGRFEAWLRRIVTHLCLNHLRRPPSVSLEEVELDEVTDNDPAHIFLAREKARAIQQAIDSLPPDYRAVIVLRFTEGLSYREMSEALNLAWTVSAAVTLLLTFALWKVSQRRERRNPTSVAVVPKELTPKQEREPQQTSPTERVVPKSPASPRRVPKSSSVKLRHPSRSRSAGMTAGLNSRTKSYAVAFTAFPLPQPLPQGEGSSPCRLSCRKSLILGEKADHCRLRDSPPLAGGAGGGGK